MEMPIINQKSCNGCGLCVGVCSCNSLVLVDNAITFVETLNVECDWCTLCETVCPTGAISCPFEIVISGDA